jgi:hypothetical protein
MTFYNEIKFSKICYKIIFCSESPREKRKESTESSGDSKNIQYVTVKSNKFQETESDEEKLKKEEKKRKDNAKG